MPTQTPGIVSTGRRAFLRWATGIGGAASALLAGVPALRAFLSPTFRHSRQEKWIRLGEVDQFDADVPTKVDFVDAVNDAWVETRRLRNVWIYTADGENFRVYNGRCTHLGCNYSLDSEKHVFRCPCHTGFFEIKTGQVLGGPPPRPLDTLDVKVENGILYCRYQDFHLGVPEKAEV
ncbi:MAG TPA: ubiquinol-cytochrome c reductase iron-sulfur subunit [Gemmatimonadales bacterium]|nr:ubiquinol-cytochrome c reductase iron-sulfur subunit [Gemmatimonadales bacterium]